MVTPREILENAYHRAFTATGNLSSQQAEWVQAIVTYSESQKAILAALITSLTKKIEMPTQDIRYHKVELPNGYSGRVYDTNHITPFIYENFPRLAMRSGSGWLTRSIEQVHPFTLDFPGRIANKQVKTAFLEILADIQEHNADPNAYLVALFHGLIQLQKLEIPQTTSVPFQQITVSKIMQVLSVHFNTPYMGAGASRLPVLALYAMYGILLETNPRYLDKQLVPLKSHTTSDTKSRSIGDIEVKDAKGSFFEAVEVKFNIPITLSLVQQTYGKFNAHPIARYYLLTTAEPNAVGIPDITEFAEHVLTTHGCEIIVNGVVPTLKYYLRLLESPVDFLTRYEQHVLEDYDLKKTHRERWLALKAQYLG